jgi:hypothetical protein
MWNCSIASATKEEICLQNRSHFLRVCFDHANFYNFPDGEIRAGGRRAIKSACFNSAAVFHWIPDVKSISKQQKTQISVSMVDKSTINVSVRDDIAIIPLIMQLRAHFFPPQSALKISHISVAKGEKSVKIRLKAKISPCHSQNHI